MSVPYLCACTYRLTCNPRLGLATGNPYRHELVTRNPDCTANHPQEAPDGP